MEHANLNLAKRLLTFLTVAALAAAVVVMALNVYADPFGAFGDRFLQWWSYDETLSPKVAKLNYLRQHHGEYDAYLVGASDNGTYPIEQMNDYFDASFYDLRADDGDMKDVEALSCYVVEQYSVKHLVLSISFSDAVAYDVQENRWKDGLPYQAVNNSPVLFYGTYLLASPRYALDKLREYQNLTYLQSGGTDPETGAADTARADTVPIGNLEQYLASNSGRFAEQDTMVSLDALEQCMESVQAIADLCREHGVELTVYCPPVYRSELEWYSAEQQTAFRTALAQITDYWDFTRSEICQDPRYFYDSLHFRSAVGTMLLAASFADESVYFPEGMGRKIEKGVVPANKTEQTAACLRTRQNRLRRVIRFRFRSLCIIM